MTTSLSNPTRLQRWMTLLATASLIPWMLHTWWNEWRSMEPTLIVYAFGPMQTFLVIAVVAVVNAGRLRSILLPVGVAFVWFLGHLVSSQVGENAVLAELNRAIENPSTVAEYEGELERISSFHPIEIRVQDIGWGGYWECGAYSGDDCVGRLTAVRIGDEFHITA